MYKTFFCVLASSALAFTFREDYKHYEEANGWIKLHKVPANWQDARLRCRAEGASLASPSNSNIRNVMISVMIAESVDPGLGIYSGIHSTFANGSYSTIEGVPISDLPVSWATGQPDHVYTENCVIFHMNGTVEDVQCSDAFEFICYKKFEALTMNKCNTVDNEYKWDVRTSHCYKFHRLGLTWSRAHMVCTAEGGYLAVINSDTEAEVLKDVFAKYPKNQIFSTYQDSAVIGFREWPEERSWYTVHGQTLEDAGYDKWPTGQPDNAYLGGETQSCGAIWRTALLDDVWCNQQFAFICEKDPQYSPNIY
uniref:C-type lectin n=1 Tax=Antheraea pernyi TaxID=7119 RepID=R9UPV0_ANTPE|nr:C-type lectin [Antheraea pernyi]